MKKELIGLKNTVCQKKKKKSVESPGNVCQKTEQKQKSQRDEK